MPATIPPAACPACKAAMNSTSIHRYSAQQAAAHFCPPSRNAERYERLLRVVQRLWGGIAADVYVCGACGFGFGWPYVGGDEEYYAILHEQAGYPVDRWEYALTIRNVMTQAAAGNVLDIGAGDGAFLKQVPANWRKYATEGSNTTRNRLAASGITCFSSTGDAIATMPSGFQVVTMFQVLEHVAPFGPLLADCFQLLEPGGTLAISVPLASAVFEQERLTCCQDMTPNHINKWSPDALTHALQRAGFERTALEIEPPTLSAALSRAGLMTRAQAAYQPRSLAAAAYRVKPRLPRLALLGGISALNLAASIHRLPSLTQGISFLMLATRPN
jgi:SAM-dependent methyltransferase